MRASLGRDDEEEAKDTCTKTNCSIQNCFASKAFPKTRSQSLRVVAMLNGGGLFGLMGPLDSCYLFLAKKTFLDSCYFFLKNYQII